MEKDDKYFKISEFAAMANVTERTIRFYDNINLLKPSSYSKSGHRIYSKQDFLRLQKILTLKYIGLSLDDIKNIIKYDAKNEDFIKSLEIQKEVINKKVSHMKAVVSAIDEALNMINNDSVHDFERFINIIRVLNNQNDWMKQYENSSNLRARIRIHELFSTNKYGWMKWYFEKIKIPDGALILELGCGDGSFWVQNIDNIPENVDIMLTDFSQGMLDDTKKALKNRNNKFKFGVVDACKIPYKDKSFDIVIANHMLYHVSDMDLALTNIKRVLKNDGVFYASTVGKNHMKEMTDIILEFAPELNFKKSFDITSKFQLENGKSILEKYFSNIEQYKYDDSLFITEAYPIIEYIFSTPQNIKNMFTEEKLYSFIAFIEKKINTNKGIKISKDTGFFKAKL